MLTHPSCSPPSRLQELTPEREGCPVRRSRVRGRRRERQESERSYGREHADHALGHAARERHEREVPVHAAGQPVEGHGENHRANERENRQEDVKARERGMLGEAGERRCPRACPATAGPRCRRPPGGKSARCSAM